MLSATYLKDKVPSICCVLSFSYGNLDHDEANYILSMSEVDLYHTKIIDVIYEWKEHTKGFCKMIVWCGIID